VREAAGLERLWAGWRNAYVSGVAQSDDRDPADEECIFCALADDDPANLQVLARGELVFALLNAYPYNSGHLMVAPKRHEGNLEALTGAETAELMEMIVAATRALKTAYQPDGVNVGMNLGRAAGAGIPGHLHCHVLPRWFADTNFMTTVAEARVLPEALSVTHERLRSAWPA
jgi:diadenosine tetraphosphate (Ap4A) HIT family hydrolase